MGGQSLQRGATALTLDQGRCTPDSRGMTYRADAGARWRDVIPTLDALGFAPKVTQANSDFTLGGAFCVNVHGWAAPLGPMGSTVRAVSLMLANGDVVRCSREVEPELFGLAMGGYGLFGVILDLEVEMVRNTRLAPTFVQLAGRDFGPRFDAAVHDPDVQMAYGRLSVARRNFFEDALMTTFKRVAGAPSPYVASQNRLAGITREIYRAQIGSEMWKEARWRAETALKPRLERNVTTRNALISEPVSALADRNPNRSDILHEYFLPPAALAGFLDDCRRIIPSSQADLLNTTLRYIAADTTSAMCFAPAKRVAAVMSFSQPLSQSADERMRPVTRALIDSALAHGGSFYLPYRLHARPDQVQRAYPNTAKFVAAKMGWDPKGLFRNTMWDQYFAPYAA